jgi:thiamine-monophosphate kinase
MPLNEFEIIQKYFSKPNKIRHDVIIGIGDDAAILKIPPENNLVVTTDTLVVNVHFPKDVSAKDIAYKALAVNLSDLAAMGAEPAWITLALTIPTNDEIWLQNFSEGLFQLINEYNLQLIGGDLTQGPLTITIQAHGFVPKQKYLLRSGAKVGDFIYITNTLGEAAVALQILQNKINLTDESIINYLFQRLNCPTPRVKEGMLLRDIANAAIDISDGLAADLGHILELSNVGATIALTCLPIKESLLEHISLEQLWHLILTGGDDYELCFTVAADKQKKLKEVIEKFNCQIHCIGIIEENPGLRIIKSDGSQYILDKTGYQHFL